MSEDWSGCITPDFVSSLEGNEIFVFGCRNSGRHWDGASAFALKHFGAIFGQREGRQGRSYAIPTIGGTIGLKEIRQSVMQFTQYAAEHPESHFLVTPIGDGSWYYQDKLGKGTTIEEKDIRLYGHIDTKCRFVEKLHI